MALAYLVCGLPASGKSTLAHKLKAETGAVRFCLDERMRAGHELTIDDPEYGTLATAEKERIWIEALAALDTGNDVIFD